MGVWFECFWVFHNLYYRMIGFQWGYWYCHSDSWLLNYHNLKVCFKGNFQLFWMLCYRQVSAVSLFSLFSFMDWPVLLVSPFIFKSRDGYSKPKKTLISLLTLPPFSTVLHDPVFSIHKQLGCKRRFCSKSCEPWQLPSYVFQQNESEWKMVCLR